jgi:hypothetical protein
MAPRYQRRHWRDRTDSEICSVRHARTVAKVFQKIWRLTCVHGTVYNGRIFETNVFWLWVVAMLLCSPRLSLVLSHV